jgi:hypothetical protein
MSYSSLNWTNWRTETVDNLIADMDELNLNSDTDETASGSSKNETETHECWTDEQRKLIMDTVLYKANKIKRLQDEIALIVRVRQNGPIDLMYKPNFTRLSKPKDNVEDIMFMKAGKTKKKKVEAVPIKKMTVEEFIGYLNGLTSSEISTENKSDNMPTDNIIDMGKYLRQSHEIIKNKDKESLNLRLVWGKNLSEAKKIYNAKKVKGEYWDIWITNTLKFSKPYVNRCILMHRFVEKYPKLRNLKITFTELFKLKKKINEIFEKNEETAKKWK